MTALLEAMTHSSNTAEIRDAVAEFGELRDRYQTEKSTHLIFIDHFDNPVSLFGASLYSSTPSLKDKDVLDFISIIRTIPSDESIDIFIHTKGGDLSAAEAIINAISQHNGIVRVIIPYYACSAGTLIAMAADEVVMDKYAFIGPVDPQYYGISVSSIAGFTSTSQPISWVGELANLAKSDAKCSMDRVKSLVEKVCQGRDKAEVDHILEELVSGKYNHDQPIFFGDIKEGKFLRHVNTKITDDMLKLFELRRTMNK